MKPKISHLKKGTLIEVNKNFPYFKTLKNKQGRVTKVNPSGKTFNAKLDGEVLEVQEGEFEIAKDKVIKVKSLYLVPWIEIEYGWGDRPEGYKVFETLEQCISETKKDFETGNYESGKGYFGPVRPLCYYEVPFDNQLANRCFVDELPKFKSGLIRID